MFVDQAYLEGGKFPSVGAGYPADGAEIEVKLGQAGGESVVGMATPDDEDDLLDNELAEAQKQLQLLIESIEDPQQESNRLQHYERSVQRQKSAQAAYLAKKKSEAAAREARGEEPLPEEDLSSNPAFRPIPKPGRLDALLLSNQMSAYCQQINQFTGQSFAKIFLMQSLNAAGGS